MDILIGFGATFSGSKTALLWPTEQVKMEGLRKYGVAPRTPLAAPCSYLFSLIGLETKGLLDLQGRRGVTAVVPWILRLVIFGGGVPEKLEKEVCIQFLSLSYLFRSGKEKQHKHKLFGPDFPRTFLTLTPG